MFGLVDHKYDIVFVSVVSTAVWSSRGKIAKEVFLVCAGEEQAQNERLRKKPKVASGRHT